MVNMLLANENLKSFILSLKLSEEQENFLLNELPTLNEMEKIDLLNTLKDVYLLNEEEKKSLDEVKKDWE